MKLAGALVCQSILLASALALALATSPVLSDDLDETAVTKSAGEDEYPTASRGPNVNQDVDAPQPVEGGGAPMEATRPINPDITRTMDPNYSHGTTPFAIPRGPPTFTHGSVITGPLVDPTRRPPVKLPPVKQPPIRYPPIKYPPTKRPQEPTFTITYFPGDVERSTPNYQSPPIVRDCVRIEAFGRWQCADEQIKVVDC